METVARRRVPPTKPSQLSAHCHRGTGLCLGEAAVRLDGCSCERTRGILLLHLWRPHTGLVDCANVEMVVKCKIKGVAARYCTW